MALVRLTLDILHLHPLTTHHLSLLRPALTLNTWYEHQPLTILSPNDVFILHAQCASHGKQGAASPDRRKRVRGREGGMKDNIMISHLRESVWRNSGGDEKSSNVERGNQQYPISMCTFMSSTAYNNQHLRQGHHFYLHVWVEFTCLLTRWWYFPFIFPAYVIKAVPYTTIIILVT